MDRRIFLTAAVAITFAPTAGLGAAEAPETWDGLIKAKSKGLNLVYLRPGADFRPYTKVMLDPTELALEKNWRRDYNSSTIMLLQRMSESELQKLIGEGVKVATEIFAEACAEGGFAVVQKPGPDVLRLRTAIVNIRISAPDRETAGRSYTFANEAGSGMLVIEGRDSLTGAVLGRAVDGRVAGDTTLGWRNRVTNQADFRVLVREWAETSVRGLAELKSLSPINPAGLTLR